MPGLLQKSGAKIRLKAAPECNAAVLKPAATDLRGRHSPKELPKIVFGPGSALKKEKRRLGRTNSSNKTSRVKMPRLASTGNKRVILLYGPWGKPFSLKRQVARMNNSTAPKKINFVSDKRGFTLIELLVVVAIVGILVSIAIPQFYSYRARGIDSQMKSDIKNVTLAMESYFSERFLYPATVADVTPFGFRQTQGVSLVINVTSPSSYVVTASKPMGTQPSFTYDSATGQTN